MKRLLVGAALALALLAVSQPTAGALPDVFVCERSETWTFSPRLSLSSSAGTFGFSSTGPCARVDVVSLTDVRPSVFLSSGGASDTYSGNCALALSPRGNQTVFIGGVVAVGYEFDSNNLTGEVFVGIPSPGVCNETRASAVGVTTWPTHL
jgi:hypothetical protein